MRTLARLVVRPGIEPRYAPAGRKRARAGMHACPHREKEVADEEQAPHLHASIRPAGKCENRKIFLSSLLVHP